jgi:hypothetical protein
MEKRRLERLEVDNIHADISDGFGFFAGTVGDLSRGGLKLDSIPKRLDDRTKLLSIVVTAKGEHFRMKVRSRWALRQSLSKSIGVEIVNTPVGWTEFVMNFEQKSEDMLVEIEL